MWSVKYNNIFDLVGIETIIYKYILDIFQLIFLFCFFKFFFRNQFKVLLKINYISNAPYKSKYSEIFSNGHLPNSWRSFFLERRHFYYFSMGILPNCGHYFNHYFKITVPIRILIRTYSCPNVITIEKSCYVRRLKLRRIRLSVKRLSVLGDGL